MFFTIFYLFIKSNNYRLIKRETFFLTYYQVL